MDKFISMWKVREIADKVTNVVMNYTEIEGKVREATNDDPWGPTGVLMQELAHATFTYEHFPEVMSMLWRRMLQDNKTNWRRTYKATLLLTYLVKNGSERVVTSAREHIYDLRSLENYTFVDENGKDQGVNVRHKVRDLIEFIQDDDRLREERKKAKKNKDKYIGMSSDAMSGMKSFDDFRHRESFNTSKSHEEKGYSDQTEYDYQYEYERGDDSDNESSGNKNAKRYRDKERSSSPSTAAASSAIESVVTTPPSLKLDDKKPISVKAPVSITKAVGTASSARTTKKGINMGAASNYGKNSDLGINSPTHRNTHNEDLFGTSDTSKVSAAKTKSIIEDIFNDANDDFNPRADEPAPKVSSTGDFGDFESAFGNQPQAPIITSTITAKPVVDSDFADFSSAFDSSQASLTQQSTAAVSLDNDNFLFSTSPQPTTATILPQTNSTNNNLLSADLFGNSVLTSTFTTSQASSNKDLLSDFGDLTLNPSTQGNILQPVAPLSFNSNNNGTSNNDSTKKQQPTVVGSTWSNVNIDLDNLMGKKNIKGPSVSMNQMKSANTSPVKSPLSANVMSPTMNSNFAFNQSNNNNNNNNNFNQFNAFQ
ncbi:clathrin interactor 1-like [Chironomus tepperi]|uniref:clathrin interactor 1-like n=1 Tax=Chironomus tepperi TaxID=113505 RepID=UPI00391FB588